jgi:glutamate-1-semialdehyde 2,1-aminomutase
MVSLKIAKNLFEEAKKYIPGGVNSPVRSFQVVGGYPVFIKQAKGSKIYSECGRGFIDYCLSWGSLILGHNHPRIRKALVETIKKGTSFGTATRQETELAKLIVEAIPSVEQVRLTNSGTEAVMSALRLARAYTKRNKIIKFAGSYHGHVDYLLAKSGSGIATFAIPKSKGIPKQFLRNTLIVPYNEPKVLIKTMKKYHRDLAAVIMEPVMANAGLILPQDGFLRTIRTLCDEYKVLLIFDEVITGFRLALGGAQEFFGIRADLTCLGKIIGGGLPAGAFGGRRKIMRLLAPQGKVYQAGTLSGNPLVVSTGITTLKILKERNVYPFLQQITERLCEGIKKCALKYGLDIKINYLSSMFSIFFTSRKVNSFKDANSQNKSLFKKFFHLLLKEGIYLSPSYFETNFLSLAHTQKEIDFTLKKIDKVFKKIRRWQ